MMPNISLAIAIAILLFVSATKINGLYIKIFKRFFLFKCNIFFRSSGDADVKGRLLTPEEGCGLTKVKNTRIVGGSIAPIGAFPWMALLGKENVFFDKIKLSFFCGKNTLDNFLFHTQY